MTLFENLNQLHIFLLFFILGTVFEFLMYPILKIAYISSKSNAFKELVKASLYLAASIAALLLLLVIPVAKSGLYVPMSFVVGNYVSYKILNKNIAKK